MAFRKHDQESYSEEDYAEEEDYLEEEEAKSSFFDKASKTFKGLFSRRKEDDYEYDDYDDSDAYGEFDEDYGTYAPAEAEAAPVTEEYAADEWGEEAFYAFEDDGENAAFSEETVEYAPETAEGEEDPFAAFAAALSEETEAGEYAYDAEDYADYAEETGYAGEEAYSDYSVFDYGEGLPETAGDEAAEDYTAEEYDPEDYAEYADYVGEAEEYADYETSDENYGEYGEYEEYGDESEYVEYEDPAPVKEKKSRSVKGFDLDKYLVPALGVIALCAVAAILFAVVTLLGTREKKAGTEPPAIVAPTATPTPAELQAAGAAPAESSSNTVKAMRDANGALVPVGDNAVVPARGVQLENDAFATSTHIGNSFVEGMQLWSDIDSCHYVCADGVSLDNMIGNYLYFVTVRNYDSIYLTLGINEIGWPADSFISKYEKVIDYIRSDSSDYTKKATIYVTSVFPTEGIMETVAGESGQPIHKDTIVEFNNALKEMCARKGCWYLDVYSALAGPDGYLPADVAADDHIHFEKTGYRIWSDYLRNHYVDESMVG